MNTAELFANAVKIAESHGLLLGRAPSSNMGGAAFSRTVTVSRFYLWTRLSNGPAQMITELIITDDPTQAGRVLGFVLDVMRTLLRDAMEHAAGRATDKIEAQILRVREGDMCNCGHVGERHLATDAGPRTGPCLDCGVDLTAYHGNSKARPVHIFRHAKGL